MKVSDDLPANLFRYRQKKPNSESEAWAHWASTKSLSKIIMKKNKTNI